MTMAGYSEEDTEWDKLNRTSWKGLGLTDPVKSVEVRVLIHSYLDMSFTQQ